MASIATKVDPTLYVILDPASSGGHDLPGLARLAAAGGASLFQLRDKVNGTRAFIEEARGLAAACRELSVPLLINDRVDVALAAGADGIHLGQDDMPAGDARRLLGKDAIIGLTVRSEAEARAAPIDMIDYISIGGVYPTSSKQGVDRYTGPDGLARIVASLAVGHGLPLCAISGIDADNAAEVIGGGVDGIAVITAVSKAPDPTAAASTLRRVVEAACRARDVP